MTVLGCIVEPTGTRAWAWADSETLVGGRPRRDDVEKIAVNHAVLTLGVAAGRVTVIEQGNRVVAGARSFQRAIESVPEALAGALRKAPRDQYGELAAVDYVVVGWDARIRRLNAYRFSSPGFDAVSLRRYCSPASEELARLWPESHADVISIAQDQLAALQRRRPLACGGRLSVAEITAAGVAVHETFDFARACLLRPTALGADARA